MTGVCGFVGSNMAQELLNRKYVVTGVDNLSQGESRNIQALSKYSSFSFVKGDVRDADLIHRLGHGTDIIVHLAAFKIPRYGHALDTLRINTQGTENVLESARKNKCRVVFSSTSDVYGKNPQLPFSEESSLVLGPTHVKRWSYAVSKIYDEHLCFGYYEEHGVPVTIVRYFGGYGPHQNLTWWGGPQSVFIDKVLKKEKIPIHGDGKQTRSFTYISDLVEGTICAMESACAVGQVYNVGNGREIQIVDLAKMIWKKIRPHEEPLIEHISYESFSGKYEDVMRRVPDLTKATLELGFKASVELEEGLPLTIEWQKQFV